MALSKERLQFSREDRARRDALTAPAIDYYGALATGDPEKITEALSPQISLIDQRYQQARKQMESLLPAGPLRDSAIARLERDRAANLGGLYTGQIVSSLDKLANLGSGFGSFSLNELGGGLRSLEGAAANNRNLMQAQAAGKQATMGFLGDLAQVGGAVATGGISGMKR